jgi:galactitol-specific phosphotransferase system IIB component
MLMEAVLFLKIAAVCGVGIGTTTMLEQFHEYKLKTKKKGDDYATYEGKSLRERAKATN